MCEGILATIRNVTSISTKFGRAKLYSFHQLSDDKEHVALYFEGETNPPIVRVHSACVTSESLGSLMCDCENQLEESLKKISQEGGVLIYLLQEGRGIGLYNKIDSYSLQEKGYDTFEANSALNFPHDMRNFQVAAEILLALEISTISLISSNPEKKKQLEMHGIFVQNCYPTQCYLNRDNSQYLATKISKAGHIFKGVKIC